MTPERAAAAIARALSVGRMNFHIRKDALDGVEFFVERNQQLERELETLQFIRDAVLNVADGMKTALDALNAEATPKPPPPPVRKPPGKAV